MTRVEKLGNPIKAGIRDHFPKQLCGDDLSARTIENQKKVKYLVFHLLKSLFKVPNRRLFFGYVKTNNLCKVSIIAKVTQYAKGWLAYFRFSQTISELQKLESWLRRRLRCAFWKQWRNGKNRFKQLRNLGVKYDLAARTAGSHQGFMANKPKPCSQHRLP